MTSLLVTYQPVFRNVALREVRLADPGVTVLERLGPAVSRVQPSVGEAAFVARMHETLPVFVRHLAPVHLDLALEGLDDPLQALVDAVAESPALDPGATFAVQCRKLSGDGLPFGARDVEVRLGSRLEAAGFTVDLEVPAQVVSAALAGCRALAGASRTADNLSSQADEHRRYSRWPAQVSRAEFKLREALETWDVRLPAGARALDLGAAPGGWSSVLAGLGLRVVAVDAGELAEPVASNPLVTHLRARLEAAGLEAESFDVLVNDMNLDPAESAALMCQVAACTSPGAPAIMTIKLPVRRPLLLLRRTLVILQHAYEVRGLRNLFHNRQEVTAFLGRRPAIASGWEELVGHDEAAARRRLEWGRCHDDLATDEGAIPRLLRAPAHERSGVPRPTPPSGTAR